MRLVFRTARFTFDLEAKKTPAPSSVSTPTATPETPPAPQRQKYPTGFRPNPAVSRRERTGSSAVVHK